MGYESTHPFCIKETEIDYTKKKNSRIVDSTDYVFEKKVN